MRSVRRGQALGLTVGCLVMLGCGSGGGGDDGGGGTGGEGASAGGLVVEGNAGSAGESGGAGGRGAGEAGATGLTGGASGEQPAGSICVNDGQCSQDQGTAICCVAPGCRGPCECRLQEDCDQPGGEYICDSSADCGDKICCEVDIGGTKQRACLPPSNCSGREVP